MKEKIRLPVLPENNPMSDLKHLAISDNWQDLTSQNTIQPS